MSMILEVHGLSKKYPGSNFHLDNISLSIPGGAIMGIVGENGAGKTTTIGCILGTLIKDSGMVRIFGEEMSDERTDIRDDIGIVFDTNSFPEHMTAAKISSAMRRIYLNWNDELFNDYLRRFNLPEKKEIKTYSRGMAMKLGFATALAHHPKLLILDEAMSGLDPVSREEILDLLLGFVGSDDRSVLISSHITTDLEKIADYITFIHDGIIILSEKKDVFIYNYGIMRCKSSQLSLIDRQDIIAYRKQDYQTDVLIADKHTARKKYADIMIDNATVDEIILMLVKGEKP